jgi:hypothetical protein
MDRMLFELAEHTYEQDLKRLDRLITKQIARERERYSAINNELDLQGTELVDDLSPRFPANHRPGRQGYGDDYIPATGHLTKRGIEICYRLFDLGKSPIAVAYLLGMTLRSAERRHQSWITAGGLKRVRAAVERYDLRSMRRLSANQAGYADGPRNGPRQAAAVRDDEVHPVSAVEPVVSAMMVS